jgi:hypothetical protein
VQLDSFAGAALKDAQHARIRLQGGLFLSEQTGAGHRRNNESKTRITFHDEVVLRDFRSICEQIIRNVKERRSLVRRTRQGELKTASP